MKNVIATMILVMVSSTLTLSSRVVLAQNQIPETQNCEDLGDGWQGVVIGGICVQTFWNKVQGYRRWTASSVDIVLDIYFVRDFGADPYPELVINKVGSYEKIEDNEVWFWHNGMARGKMFELLDENIEEDGTAYLSVNADLWELLKEMSRSDESILQIELKDYVLDANTKEAMQDMIYIWENHFEELQ